MSEVWFFGLPSSLLMWALVWRRGAGACVADAAPMKCLELDCKRARLPGYSRCESCLTALLSRIFGRSADYPVRAA